MFAVIRTGGKQYRVEPGDVLDIEIANDKAEVGQKVALDQVLLVYGDGGTRVGNPLIPGAIVEATLLNDVRGPKVRIFKHKKRKAFRKRGGHRQDLQRVKVERIVI
jgi:large subunit ribosomal protein L21